MIGLGTKPSGLHRPPDTACVATDHMQSRCTSAAAAHQNLYSDGALCVACDVQQAEMGH